MNQIGKRIKSIRKKKGLKQSNLLVNQSHISQIENGTNRNPSESILKEIANNLDISFQKLIKETDWAINSSNKNFDKKIKFYAISSSDYSLKINNGSYKIERVHYPLTNEDRSENKFCPIQGLPLIIECEKCKKKIEDFKFLYCIGCGNRLINKPNIIHQIKDLLIENFNRLPIVEDTLYELNDMDKILNEMEGYIDLIIKKPKSFNDEKIFNKLGYIVRKRDINKYMKNGEVNIKKIGELKIDIDVNLNLVDQLRTFLMDKREVMHDSNYNRTEQESNEFKLGFQRRIAQNIITLLETNTIGNDDESKIKLNLDIIEQLSELINIEPNDKIQQKINKIEKDHNLDKKISKNI